MLHRIQQFIREADALGLRIQGLTITPSRTRLHPVGAAFPLPEVVVVEHNGSEHCIVTVEPRAEASESRASGQTDPPSEADTASVRRRGPAADDTDGASGLKSEGTRGIGGGGDVDGVHRQDGDAAGTESGNRGTD